jgi:hypothetical protein
MGTLLQCSSIHFKEEVSFDAEVFINFRPFRRCNMLRKSVTVVVGWRKGRKSHKVGGKSW